MTQSSSPAWQAPIRFVRHLVTNPYDPRFCPRLKGVLLLLAFGWSLGAIAGAIVGTVQIFSAPSPQVQTTSAPVQWGNGHA